MAGEINLSIGDLGCCPFEGSNSVGVYSLFVVALFVCVSVVLLPCLFVLIFYVSVNNFSVMSERVFLG